MNSSKRFVPVDALRGLIMLLMALDHANLFVAHQHSTGEYYGGQFPVYRDALSFLTRFATHPAAPGFFLLMGIGMAIFARRRLSQGWSVGRIRLHFVLRGLLLVALQLLVVNRAWELSPGWGLDYYFGVLVALGGCMALGGLFVFTPPAVLLGLALAALLGAELLTPSPAQWGPFYSFPHSLLLVPGGREGWWVTYPVLQWLELVLFGLAFGGWLAGDRRGAYRRAAGFAALFLLLFLLVRLPDGFGNLRPRPGGSWIDILNLVKYPPSIAFTLLTTSFNLGMLALFGWLAERFERALAALQPLVVIGAVPLFFYVAHLFLYAGLGRMLAPDGSSIPAMLPVWLVGVLMLWPLCLWYGRLKQRQPPGSLLHYF